jgi:25S rRNA (uracil2843-N3)-methyltransferase
MIGPNTTLLTLCFTLGELYSISIPKKSAFLIKLTAAGLRGSLLLVVDTPGAYAKSGTQNDETAQEKKSPMDRLMYKALLPKIPQKAEEVKEAAAWGKLVEEDNYLLQLPEGLRFPVSLENIKFQLHLLEQL